MINNVHKQEHSIQVIVCTKFNKFFYTSIFLLPKFSNSEIEFIWLNFQSNVKKNQNKQNYKCQNNYQLHSISIINTLQHDFPQIHHICNNPHLPRPSVFAPRMLPRSFSRLPHRRNRRSNQKGARTKRRFEKKTEFGSNMRRMSLVPRGKCQKNDNVFEKSTIILAETVRGCKLFHRRVCFERWVLVKNMAFYFMVYGSAILRRNHVHNSFIFIKKLFLSAFFEKFVCLLSAFGCGRGLSPS